MKEATSELVRINDKGEAHPVGVVASRRMRDRSGAFRVLPAPDHVVFMRYTGEDGRRDEEDGAIVKLAGEITAPAALCDIIAMLGHTRWQGELVVLSACDTQRGVKRGDSVLMRDWLIFDSVEEAETFFHERG